MSHAWIDRAFSESVPPPPEKSAVKWCEQNLWLPGSQRTPTGRFNSSVTPWTCDPLEDSCDDETKFSVFIKPIQCGGSVVGYGTIIKHVVTNASGHVGYYWPSDRKAEDRWDEEFEKVLLACPPISDKIAKLPTGKFTRGKAIFPHLYISMLGANLQGNVESGTLTLCVCEEVHDNDNNRGWSPGRLRQVIGRTTAAWNAKIVVISNASVRGDQLHEIFVNGTQQRWEVKCPGCGQFHVMRTRWEDKNPKLGGLRYDSDKCKRKDGGFDYNALEASLRYQMPCGFVVRDTPAERRALSLSGRYSEPNNTGAKLSHRSRTLEAVSVDYIPFLTLVQEKHSALRARRFGDNKPWEKYLKERECVFYHAEEIPLLGMVTLTENVVKNREGWSERYARVFFLDYQHGHQVHGELPHWWLAIRDVMPNADSMLVYEGRIESDMNVIDTLAKHSCLFQDVERGWHCCRGVLGAADSGYDATKVYLFCQQHGISAVKGSADRTFRHRDGTAKIYEDHEMQPLADRMTGGLLRFEPDRDPITLQVVHYDPFEPRFFRYSKPGILERLAWFRSPPRDGEDKPKWIVPADVSEEYQKHLEAWRFEHGAWTKESEQTPDHLLMCEAGCAMLIEILGVIGSTQP